MRNSWLFRFNGCKLSIVPSWNWNVDKLIKQGLSLTYQSYHRGIEIYIDVLTALLYWNYQSYHRGIEITENVLNAYPGLAINRTIVELKYFLPELGHPGFVAINRTIVELKSSCWNPPSLRLMLSIVPSWNWNTLKNNLKRKQMAINRTIVELKLLQGSGEVVFSNAINRTIVELKFRLW